MVKNAPYNKDEVMQVLDLVMDPEIPVISVVDLGIVRNVEFDDQKIIITITPTYTGCPAMDMIRAQIKMELLAAGFPEVEVKQVLSPAWTTDWMTERGKHRLVEYGIAAPLPRQSVCTPARFAEEEAIQCPHCKSYQTKRISEFGSTACKSLYRCESCREPFDYFKCH
ncbi:MAG: phenylacetate-CoA oxygenase subunit PaaJ [Chitinophagaceae bacterium]|nr:phenylacetate-CoA oxygenase subunit PaaJ [Chitinophagaceae bacterium]